MASSELSRSIRSAVEQVEMVKVLTNELGLPDPSKRKGLKQFLTTFSNINKKINDCFDAHRNRPHTDWPVLTTIVNLWAMLGMDVVLRDKLFESGVLERITPLLQEGDGAVRTSILFALSSLANYGSFGSRRTIAELTTPTLIDIISNSDCSASDARLSMVILARGLGTVLLETSLKYTPGEQVNTPELLCNLDGKRACSAIGAVIRRSDVDTEVVWRGTSILRSLAFYFRDAVLATHTERLFVAALASKDIQVRLDGLLGILRLGASVAQLESQQVKPMHVAAIAHSPETYFTPELMQAVRSQHGWLKGGMIQEILESVILLDEAIVRLEKTGDAVGFGRTLSKRVLTCEYSFSKGRVSDLEKEREPLANYFERAAEALATSGDPGDTHLSFVLLVKLAMVLNDREKVLKLSAEGLKRHSESAFFYYAQTTVIRDSRTSLRLAMQGLACSDLTDYVKRVLLERSAEAAYHMTITGPLHHAVPGSPAWREGLAILHCAQEASKAYIGMASMDQIRLKTIIYIYLCVTFVLHGDQVLNNLNMIRPYLEKLSVAEQIRAIICQPLAFTEEKLAVDLIIPQFAKRLQQWRTPLARLADNGLPYRRPHDLPADDPNYVLANWLVRTAQDNEDVTWVEFAEIRPQDSEMLALGTGAQDAFLYRCSLCGNPSASLKRCGRCKQARYCDDNCQRKHWKKGHKLVCKPA